VNLVDHYDGFVFDLDGTVHLGGVLLPGVRSTIDAIHRVGKPLVFLTNKPLEPSSAYAAHLTDLGLPTAPEHVLSSLDSLVLYLRVNHPDASVLPVAEALVTATLAAAGQSIAGWPEQADVVVVSFDRTFDYRKLHDAYRAVRGGAATNPDPYCPTPEGGLPDCAAMLAAIEACTGARAEAIVGKPSAHMTDALTARLQLPPDRLLLCGDRLDTDVAMARRAGMDAALVLTGATHRDQVASEAPPTYVLDNLGALLTTDPSPADLLSTATTR
jgi:HAD superfamily hydrolase (TIGR01450 family)